MNIAVEILLKEKELKLKDIEAQKQIIKDLSGEVAAITEAINRLNSETKHNTPDKITLVDLDNFVPQTRRKNNNTLVDDFTRYIDKVNRFVHTSVLHKEFYDENEYESERVFKDKVSNTLSDLRKRGVLAKYSENNSNIKTYWGRPSWLNEVGEPKTLYEPEWI